MKIYKSAIISNLPNTILIDKIIFDIKSRSTVVIPTERPVLERADDDSNNASTKSLLLRKEIAIPLPIERITNNIVTKIASLKALSYNSGSFWLSRYTRSFFDFSIFFFESENFWPFLFLRNWMAVDEIDNGVNASDIAKKIVLPLNFWKINNNLAIFIPPAVEKAVPPTNMTKIRNNFPSNVKEDRLINENPVVVDALTTWNNEVSQLCVEMEGSIIINKTAESKTKNR